MSGVELARLAKSAAIPATHAEGEALRASAGLGPGGGGNIGELIVGLKRRYGWALGYTETSTFDQLWATLRPGYAAAVQGSMGAFPAGHTFRRWDPGFAGGHCMLFMRLDATDLVWFCDPLAPVGTYRGELMLKSAFQRFVTSLPGGRSLVARIIPEARPPTPPEAIVPALPITSEVPALIDVAAGSKLLKLDGSPIMVLKNQYLGALSPYAVGNLRAWYVLLGGIKQVALVAPAKVTPILDTTPFDQKAIDEAKAAAAAAGTSTEKSRLRSLLGL